MSQIMPKFNDQIPDYAVPPVVGDMRPINRGVYKNGGYPENPMIYPHFPHL